MFRSLMIPIAALAVATAGWPLPAQAAPVSGSARLDIVFTPLFVGEVLGYDFRAKLKNCSSDPTEFEPCKIDEIIVKLELDLLLTLSVSGVDITSISIFTFKGLEFQSFVATGTVGALAFRTQLIFAPNIIELQLIRDIYGRPDYCINAIDPPLPPDLEFLLCPTTNTGLWLLLEDITIRDFFDVLERDVPLIIPQLLSDLFLASLFDLVGHLDPALTFRKKAVDLSLSLAGLTIGLRGMFANIDSPTTPNWRMGVVASVEGQTVSGITIRAESWIGARQGLECFGECKPLERIRGGKVEDQFVIYEEKIFIRNLKIAGVTLGARLEFAFADAPVGLSFLQLTQDFTVAPFGLAINNVIDVMPDPNTNALTIVRDVITTSVKVGDVSVLAQLFVLPVYGVFTIVAAQLISTFDAPGVKVTDILVPCLEESFCQFSGGLIHHSLILSASVGEVTLDIRLDFRGLFTGFHLAVIEVVWKLGNVTILSSSVIPVDPLYDEIGEILPSMIQKIGIELTF